MSKDKIQIEKLLQTRTCIHYTCTHEFTQICICTQVKSCAYFSSTVDKLCAYHSQE